jgi:DNA-binding IclR family transcriptional regulator
VHELPPPPLGPTSRMILAAVRSASRPLSLADLTTETGAAAITVLKLTQILVRTGHLERIRSGKFSYFTLPVQKDTAQ